MRAGQRLVASDGKEVMLFPLPYMYISQDEGGSYSHSGVLAIDFLGWGSSGRIFNAPMYAPCSCRCVATIDAYNKGRIFQSLDKVHTPSGLQYVTFMWFHDNNPIASVGDIFTQGDLIGHTGTAGDVTGDHTHMNMANGVYAGWENVPPNNNGQLKNSNHIYDICYVNDTVLSYPLSHDWLIFQGGSGTIGKSKFKWVLYANKLRQRKNV